LGGKLKELAQSVDKLIVGGDFNLIMDKKFDSIGAEPTMHKECIEAIKAIMAEHDLVDLFRMKNGKNQIVTFAPLGKNSKEIHRRLDYIYVSEPMAQHCCSEAVEFFAGTDHKALSFQIMDQDRQEENGRGYWRHNNMYNTDEVFVRRLKGQINEIFLREVNEFEDPRMAWEFLKYRIRGFCKKYARDKAIEKRARSNKIKRAVEDLTIEIEHLAKDGEPPEDLVELRAEHTKELDDLLEEEAAATIFRSKVNYWEMGEKCTKYFFNLIRANNERANISRLKVNGAVTENKKQIEDYVQEFYSRLYSKEERTPQDTELITQFLAEENIKKLTIEQEKTLETPVTKAEIRNILFKECKTGKAPGSDGLSTELYRVIWQEVEEVFFNAINKAIEAGELSASQRQSVIKLLKKKGKCELDLENWRPISLMNYDAKIFAKLLAHRMEKVLANIIHCDQTAFIKGRNIAEGIRKLQYLFDKQYREQRPGAFINVDFRKAFDSIDHDYMFQVLRAYGFGQKYISMVQTLYNGAESTVMNKGKASKYFRLERSCRQGDPLSPYLFILAVEPLLNKIRREDRVEGLRWYNRHFKITAYADDVTIAVANRASAKRALEIIEDFGRCSGLKLNRSKTEIMQIGREDVDILSGLGISRVGKMKITGVVLGWDRKEVEEDNFKPALDKLSRVLNMWKGRNLSVLGRVMAVKAQAISLFQFLGSIIAVPEKIIIKINKLIYGFVWKGSDRITRTEAAKPLDKGGIGLHNIKDIMRSSRIQWIKKAVKFKERDWTVFLHEDFKVVGGLLSLQGGVHKNIVQTKGKSMLPFNQTILDDITIVTNNPTDELKIGKIGLFNNREILDRKRKSLFRKGLNDIGIRRIEDMCDEEGKLLCGEEVRSMGISTILALEWEGVYQAIPTSWKEKTKGTVKGKIQKGSAENFVQKTQQDEFYFTIGDTEISMASCSQKRVLKAIEESKPPKLPPYRTRMTEKYNIGPEQWDKIFKQVGDWSLSTRLRSFAWRMLVGNLYTKTDLMVFKISQDSKCSFCEEEGQTKEHMLLTCSKVVQFRNTVLVKFQKTMNNTNMNEQDWLFGVQKDHGGNATNNLIFLINKHIYFKNLWGKELNIQAFTNEVIAAAKVEREFLKQKGRLGLFEGKWGELLREAGEPSLLGKNYM
jgi:hypothetical protein